MKRIKGIVAGIAAIAVLPALTACTAAYRDVYEVFNYAFSTLSAEDVTLSPEEIAEFPYSGLYIRRGGQPQAFIVLGYIDQQGEYEQRSWISADRITIVTEAGRIVQTVGQTEMLAAAELGEHDLIATSNRSQDPLHCIITNPEHCALTYEREIDYTDRNRARSAKVTSTFRIESGPTTISLPAGNYQAYYVIEDGVFQPSGESFRNEYWIEPDGHVLRSAQQIKPNDALITLEQVKWVGRDEDE
ncbi:MAG: YjbF family lipoprotein [Idiomarina sp.]|nr:YjbF family lipoprotein [Idiomarina sp.]